MTLIKKFLKNQMDISKSLEAVIISESPPPLIESRRKVRAEKSLNRRKSRTFFLSNIFPPIFFGSYGSRGTTTMALILKLVPNDEE